MANLGIEIKRKCPICGKVFIIKALGSFYCSPKCSKVANKRKKDKEKKEAVFATYAQHVPDIREYLTARQVVAIYRTIGKSFASQHSFPEHSIQFVRVYRMRRA